MSKQLNQILLAQLNQNQDELDKLHQTSKSIIDANKEVLNDFSSLITRFYTVEENSPKLVTTISQAIKEYANK